jgi:soluble lytic murein transglycosylase-like protein
MLLSEGPGRQNIIIATLVGWLIMVGIVGKMFLGCSASFQQVADSFQEQFYKVEASSCDTAGLQGIIALPSVLDGALSFLGDMGSVGILETTMETDATVPDLSAMAMIGANQATVTAGRIEKTTPSRSVLFHPIIDRAATQYQVDPALVRAIIFAESGYNPTAVSNRGAMGLMQLMPSTAKAMGVEDCFDPEHNIYGGVKYFKKLFNQFGGDVKLALAAYNAGSRKVREFNGVPPFRATERYIQKVLKYYDIYKGQQPEPVGLS